MAEKGFGVKEINLIGASGTPTIESPNNLNLNAVNVAISTNATIGGNLTVTGTVGIAGTLTYEDVTNVDAIGIVTAREGVKIPDNKSVVMGTDGDAQLYHSGSHQYLLNTTGNTYLMPKASQTGIYLEPDGTVKLHYSGGERLATSNAGITVTGTVSATVFNGNGASLTNLPAGQLTGTLPALDGSALTGIAVTEAPVTDYTISANGSSAYRFHGGGVDETANNPDLYLIRGQKYRFNNTTGSGHPFAIREANGGSAYTNGVTGNNQGVQFFTVPYDAPAKIFYQCTIHGGMVGNIYIRGANGANENVGVTTFANITANNINGTPNINVGTGEVDIYSTGSGDKLSLRLLNSDASAGNKIGIYFGPANNVAGAYIKGIAESDFTSTANRDAGLELGTRLNGNFVESLKISAAGSVNKPKNPAFYAYLTANNAVYTAGTVVPWANTTIDTRSAFQTSGSDQGRYIVPTGGIYYFGWRLNRLGNSRYDIGIYKNGSIQYIDELRSDHGTGTWQMESGHYLMSCNANQKIDLRIYAVSNAGSGQFDGGGNGYYDAFFGWMVG